MVFLQLQMSEETQNTAKKPRKLATLEEEMSFFGHLAVLRWHLVRAAFAIVVLLR